MRKWYWVHKGSSLICTGFLLIMGITGLPLVFRDEIVNWLHALPAAAESIGREAAAPDLDALIARARGPSGLYPGQIVRWISLERDRPEIWIGLAPSYEADRRLDHSVRFDAHTGETLAPIPASRAGLALFLGKVLKLHQDLLMGAWGEVLMAAMAGLFLTATISGVVLYAPFLRTVGFGAMRRRNARILWLDMHNLLGIVLTAWGLIVGATGLMNEMSDALYDHWRDAALSPALEPNRGQPMPQEAASVQRVLETAARAMPGMRVRSIRFPDAQLGSPRHFLIWGIGDTHLTSRLFQPGLVDVQTGLFIPLEKAPWYLKAVQLSRPLHFGDYGGLPLKIIWVSFDLVTIVILLSGLYLWLGKGRDRAESEP